MTATRVPTLITTPADAAHCDRCDSYGARFPGDVDTYPHCPVCGSTDLADMRSPFEVLAEARTLAADTTLRPEVRIDRVQAAFDIERMAEAAGADHCGDCAAWARKAGRL